MIRMMDFEFLLASELDTNRESKTNFSDAESTITSYLNSFFKYSYYLKEDFEPESSDHYFHSFAFYTYYRLPYSIRAIYKLWEEGYYLESLIILRHIVEGFIQLRYFYKYKEKIEPHFAATRSRDRISFKTMFNEFSDGFYEIMYGKFFSRFAHGHVVTSIFKAEFTPDKKQKLVYGSKYDDLKSRLVINQLGMYCYAYLNFIDVFFPKFAEELGEEGYNEYVKELEKLREIMHQPKETEEQQKDYERMIQPIIEK